ncbi:radical SAM protein [Thermodesulfobacteriota bacterium]
MLSSFKLSLDIIKTTGLQGHPFLLYLKPTARCNLRCKSCNRWQDESSISEEMPLDEIREVLTKFRKAGLAVCTLWGGEPTLRSDLPEILASAKQLGYRTAMCTNCLVLAKKADQILPNLDTLLCSLDGYGEAHDRFRGVEGLFDSVVKAMEIATAKYPNCYIKIWASVHKGSYDQVEKLAELAKRFGAGIEYFPISRIEGYNDDQVADKEDLDRIFGKIIELKHKGYPVYNPDKVLKVMQHEEPFSCNFGRAAIHLDHQGNVYSCEDSAGTPRHNWCHHSEFDPEKVFKSEKFAQVMSGLRECNCCRLPCVVELSGSLFRSLAGMFLSRRKWIA